MPTKPSYAKLSVSAVFEGSTTSAEIASFITEKYGKCSMKCLNKAIEKNQNAGIMIQVTQAGHTRLDISEEKKRYLRRKKKKADPNRSLKPLTGYNMYVRSRISSREDPNIPITELMKEIARRWMTMTGEQKQDYKDQAAAANLLR